MALKVWSELLPEARLNVAGCPDPIIEHYLRSAAIDLCVRSKALRFEMPAFDTEAGAPFYTLAPAAETEAVQIVDATVDGEPLDPVRRDELARVSKWPAESGTPTRFMMIEGNRSVLLWKTPDVALPIVLLLAVKPTLSATGIDSAFSDMFGDVITAGALATLFALPKKDWSDGNLSTYHKGIFETGVIRARAFAEKDGTRAPLRTTAYGRF